MFSFAVFALNVSIQSVYMAGTYVFWSKCLYIPLNFSILNLFDVFLNFLCFVVLTLPVALLWLCK